MARLPFFRSHSAWREQLDAFVDGELARPALDALTAHLDVCADCVAAVVELREVKRIMVTVPELEPPRSFRLTPAMIAREREPGYVPVPRIFVRVAQMTAAVAVMALVAVVVVDLSREGDGGETSTAAPVAELAAQTGSEQAPASDSIAPQPTATLRPVSGGGVSGAGAGSPDAGRSSATPTAAAKGAQADNYDATAEDVPQGEAIGGSAPTARSDAASTRDLAYRFIEAGLAVLALAATGWYFVLRRSIRE